MNITFLSLLLIVPVITLTGPWVIWRQRRSPISLPIVLMGLFAAFWGVCYAFEVASLTLPLKKFWLALKYLVIPYIPVLVLVFMVRFIGKGRWPSRGLMAVLLFIPLFSTLAALSNPWHTQFWRAASLMTYDGYTALHVVRGPLFWVYLAYSYMMITAGLVYTGAHLFAMLARYPRQTILVIAGLLLPILTNLLSMAGLNPLPGIDLSSAASSVSAVAFVLAAYSQVGLMNVVPLAYSTLISQLQDGLIVIDTNAIIQEVNPTAEQITGLKRSDVIGEPANQVAHPSFPELTEALSAAFSRREVHVTEGERPGCYEFIVSPLHTDAGDLVGRMLVWHDISERKQLEERLRYASSHDYLTGLYNRTFYEEQLALVRKSRTWPTTVIALDLDNLKLINDQYGHASGDQLLKRAARVLSTCLRKGDIVARVGGDEFMVIMQNSSEQDAKIICERMLSLTQAENDAHPEMILQFSVGFAAAADASALDDAIACADQMMYLDKSRHKYPRP